MAGISPYPIEMMQGSGSGTPAASGTKSANVTMMGDGVNPNFVIPHTVGAMPVYANVVARNVNAIGNYSVMWDASNITIMYEFPPNEGELQLTWIAAK